jgi:predicted metal-dependent hydrolase
MKMNLPCAFWPFGVRTTAKRGHARPDILGEKKVALDGQLVAYTLKRSPRARCVRLEVREGTGLTVVVPRSYRLGKIDDLLKGKARWILRNLARHVWEEPLSTARELRSGDTVPYLGREVRVVDCQAFGCALSANLTQNELVVSRESDRERLDLLLERWYRAQAVEVIKQRVDRLVTRLGLSYRRIIIRGQRTRWGSCSHKGNLSFNWRLIMAPEPVIDYVIVHEVTHLKELSHSKRFWKLVAEECPGWREHRKWLDEHGAELNARLVPQQ